MLVSFKVLVAGSVSFVVYVKVAHLFPFHFYFLTTVNLTSSALILCKNTDWFLIIILQ